MEDGVPFKWTNELTFKFIDLRKQRKKRFNGRRHQVTAVYEEILRELGLTGIITPQQIKKKWQNLVTKYKDLKRPKIGQDPDERHATAIAWPFFQTMDEHLRHKQIINLHLLQPSDSSIISSKLPTSPSFPSISFCLPPCPTDTPSSSSPQNILSFSQPYQSISGSSSPEVIPPTSEPIAINFEHISPISKPNFISVSNPSPQLSTQKGSKRTIEGVICKEREAEFIRMGQELIQLKKDNLEIKRKLLEETKNYNAKKIEIKERKICELKRIADYLEKIKRI